MVKAKRRKNAIALLLAGVFQELLLLIDDVWKYLIKCSLPVTKHVFSRHPAPPVLKVKDVRGNRVRFEIVQQLTSPFNVEQYEIRHRIVGDSCANWKCSALSDLDTRTVARLQGGREYEFCARAHSNRGISEWGAVVRCTTRQQPEAGGGRGAGYTWTQTAYEAAITLPLPHGNVTKRQLSLELRPRRLWVVVEPTSDAEPPLVLAEGELYGAVRGWQDGSYWELSRQHGSAVLVVTLEKVERSVSTKFDYWRSFFTGHQEIDTHMLVQEDPGTWMQPGMGMDPRLLAGKDV